LVRYKSPVGFEYVHDCIYEPACMLVFATPKASDSVALIERITIEQQTVFSKAACFVSVGSTSTSSDSIALASSINTLARLSSAVDKSRHRASMSDTSANAIFLLFLPGCALARGCAFRFRLWPRRFDGLRSTHGHKPAIDVLFGFLVGNVDDHARHGCS